jgi:mannose/fructose/N-acetylgalactosamine-specific phosphotransferase system component IID
MFFRCFFIQASWNFKAMIGLGFCYSAIPIAKRLCRDEAEQEDFLRRHMAFFNAHPYFVSWCLGAVAKLEQEARWKKWQDLGPISIFKDRLTGPLGVIGDNLFWTGLKPLSAGVGVLIALVAGWLALPLFLILYNIPHLLIRARGLVQSYRKGFDIVSNLSLRRYQKWLQTISTLGIVVAGLCTAAAAKWASEGGAAYLFSFIIAVLIGFILSYTRKPVNLSLVMAWIISVVISLFTHFHSL